MFILLPLSDEGIPATVEEKRSIVRTILERAYALGFTKEDIVVDALNVGLLCMSKDKEKEAEQQAAVMGFISRYGLLGLMTTITCTALPTTRPTSAPTRTTMWCPTSSRTT